MEDETEQHRPPTRVFVEESETKPSPNLIEVFNNTPLIEALSYILDGYLLETKTDKNGNLILKPKRLEGSEPLLSGDGKTQFLFTINSAGWQVHALTVYSSEDEVRHSAKMFMRFLRWDLARNFGKYGIKYQDLNSKGRHLLVSVVKLYEDNLRKSIKGKGLTTFAQTSHTSEVIQEGNDRKRFGLFG